MSYSFSISGHVSSDEEEWELIQQVARAVQDAGSSSATGNTQFHGVVDLMKVQLFRDSETEPVTVDSKPVEQEDHPTSSDETVRAVEQEDGTIQTTVYNAAGEVVGFR